MGFCINYRTARPVSRAEADAIVRDAHRAVEGRDWGRCEPVAFYRDSEDELSDAFHLQGGSKVVFDPGDGEPAEPGLPAGTLLTNLDILSQLSRDHGVDWEVGHDAADEPVGLIRAGVCDAEVSRQLEALAAFSAELMGESGDPDQD
ncbi:hypothetical protein TA3x_003593 [Tundrisphaera sp. TA3]|uniref:hypothetical protein n=1 Tax=Tundrisphaera sp. TA3 TaxID=3435775 RepID=UPI003EC100F2